MVPPLSLCAYMKKGPNLRWSLIQCSGGDEGDRTPDLLTASQALSQLSYAPVRRSTIRELGRRCKENFGKLSPPRPRIRTRERAAKPRNARSGPLGAPSGRRPRRPAFQRPYDISSSTVRRLAFAARAATRSTAIPPAPGPLSGPIALPPARRLQNHAGLRGQDGNPRACRNRQYQNRW